MNRFEDEARAEIERDGWMILKTGWPDFIILDGDGELVCFAELKASGDKVRPEQKRVHDVLRRAGLQVCVVEERDLHKFVTQLGLTGKKEKTFLRLSDAVKRLPSFQPYPTRDELMRPQHGVGYCDDVMRPTTLGEMLGESYKWQHPVYRGER